MPFSSGSNAKELLEKHGFSVIWRPFDGGHEIPPPVLADMDRFLFPSLTLTGEASQQMSEELIAALAIVPVVGPAKEGAQLAL